MMCEGSLAAQNIGMLVKEIMNGPHQRIRRKETSEEMIQREEFNDEKEFIIEGTEDVLCIDNKAATQILLQESGSWRTRHLRVRAASLK